MAENVKEEMNKKTDCIPAKWSRNTVADGDWLQKNTIAPLSSRDDFLADKLSAASVNLDALSAAIDSVSSISDSKDTFLSGSIDYVSATLDTFSGKVETSAKSLYDSISAESDARRRGDEDLQGKINVLEAANDVIMVYGTHEEFVAGSASLHLTDKDVIKVLFDDTVSSNQVYYEYTLSTNSWTKIGELDPYYSKADIESFSANLSSTIANTYLSANNNDIKNGKNINVAFGNNNGDPYITINTLNDVSFDNVSATTFSGKNIKGETKTSTIDGLITSAENGQKVYNGKTTIEIYSNKNEGYNTDTYEISSINDKFSFYVSADKTNDWLGFTTATNPGTNTIVLSANSNLGANWFGVNYKMNTSDFENWSGGDNSKFNGSARLAGSAGLAYSATMASNSQDIITAYYKDGNTDKTGTFNVSSLKLSAGKGISFVSSNNQLSISSEGTTYTTGQYIDISNVNNVNTISVTGDLIGSAQSGQSAYNWITTQSATLSAGFGIQFTSAAQNTMGIKLSATTVDGKITQIGGVPLSAGANYQDGRCISIGDDNKINLSYNISATNISSNNLYLSGSSALYQGGPTDFSFENGVLKLSHDNGNSKVYFDGQHLALSQSNMVTWGQVISSTTGNWVSSNPAGITLSSNRKVNVIFADVLPTLLEDNTYYIV